MSRLSRFSNGLLRLEKGLVTMLAAALLLLILLNIVTRELDAALFWVDELAIYTMIWMAMIGASVMVRQRSAVAVTIVTDLLPLPIRRMATRVVDALIAFLAIVLLVLCWLWYDPIALISAGFDFDAFAQDTLKFIYSEPTNTIGIRKFWLWLAVPFMALTMSVHSLANLLEGPSGAGSKPQGSGG